MHKLFHKNNILFVYVTKYFYIILFTNIKEGYFLKFDTIYKIKIFLKKYKYLNLHKSFFINKYIIFSFLRCNIFNNIKLLFIIWTLLSVNKIRILECNFLKIQFCIKHKIIPIRHNIIPYFPIYFLLQYIKITKAYMILEKSLQDFQLWKSEK